MTMHTFLLILLLLSSIAAVLVSDLLLSALSLGAASVALTLILFAMNAPWAAVFELSVCAGLITVLFISAVSIIRKEEQFLREDRSRFWAVLPLLGLFGLAFWLFSEPLTKALLPGNAGAAISVGDMLWQVRWFDVFGQLCIFVAGVLAVAAFFRSKNNA